MSAYRIAVVPGDGIGKEVVPAARRVLDRAAQLWGISLEWGSFDWGGEYSLRHGHIMPPDGLDRLAEFDAIFLGAIGHPQVAEHRAAWELIMPTRRRFQQYVNLRPIRLLRGIDSPLRSVPEGGVDFLVVRENNEGEYTDVGGRIYSGTAQEAAIQTAVFTRFGVERVMRYAFDLAQARASRLTVATKSNALFHSMPFWDEVLEQVQAGYPGVTVDKHHIDALAAYFVLRPGSFDVVVSTNLFGDILTDLGAALVGSIGVAPSANLNPGRRHPSMFEPIHGSAPDIAGRGVANPIGQVWSGAMMLEHLGHADAAEAVLAAVEDVLTRTPLRTADLGGSATTVEVTEGILSALSDHRPADLSPSGR